MSQENREIRVFISSTFRDMEGERNILRDKVFPSVRRKYRERDVELTVIDLRWGLTDEQAQMGRAVSTCLKEVDRCHPFFIGLVGHRYGWIPESLEHDPAEPELSDKVQRWLGENLSVTAMEIQHGVFDQLAANKNVDAHFYLRDLEFTELLAGEGTYFFGDDEKHEKLRTLLTEDHRVPSESYASYEVLAEKVESDLLALLDKHYKKKEKLDELDKLSSPHIRFRTERVSDYVANDDFLQETEKKLFESHRVVIHGGSGMGKSSTVAALVERFSQLYPKALVIDHYPGAAPGATAPSIALRIIKEAKNILQADDHIPDMDVDIIEAMPQWIGRVASFGVPILVAIDALNQIDDEWGVQWIPDIAHENIYTIVSTTRSKDVSILLKNDWVGIPARPLSEDQIRLVINRYLTKYHKSLTDDQITRIAASKQTDEPLYLRVLLEELASFGGLKDGEVSQNEFMDGVISDYLAAENTASLYEMMLGRLEGAFGNEEASVFLGCLVASRSGLSVEELFDINNRDHQEGDTYQLPMVTIAGIRNFLDFHLSDREGLLYFAHQSLLDSASARLGSVERMSDMIVSYFNSMEISHRQIDELPWQFMQKGNHSALRAYLEKLDVFSFFNFRRNWYLEMYGYWRACAMNAQRAATNYLDQLSHLPKEKIAHECQWLAFYFQYIGAYSESDTFIRKLEECTDDLSLILKGKLLRSENLSREGQYHHSEALLQDVLSESWGAFSQGKVQFRPLIIKSAKDLVNTIINRVYAEDGQNQEVSLVDLQEAEGLYRALGDMPEFDPTLSEEGLAGVLLCQGYILERQAIAMQMAAGLDGMPDFSASDEKLLDAMTYAERVLEIITRKFGDYDLNVVSAYKVLANIQSVLATNAMIAEPKKALERYIQAGTLFARVVEIRSEFLGEGYPDNHWDLRDRAKCLINAGRLHVTSEHEFDKGLSCLLDAITLYGEVLGLISPAHSRRAEVKGDAIKFCLLAGKELLRCHRGIECLPLFQNMLTLEEKHSSAWFDLLVEVGGTLIVYGATVLNEDVNAACAILIAVEEMYANSEGCSDVNAQAASVIRQHREQIQVVYSQSATLLASENDFEGAEAMFRKAITISANDMLSEECFRNLAVLLVQKAMKLNATGAFQQAISCLSEASQMFADQIETFDGDVQKVLQARTRHCETLRMLAKVMFESGDKAGAMKVLIENGMIEV